MTATQQTFRLDRDCPRRPEGRAHSGQLRHAAAEHVVRAPLVHLDRLQLLARTHELIFELVERVSRARDRGDRRTKRCEQRADLGHGKGEGRLRHRV